MTAVQVAPTRSVSSAPPALELDQFSLTVPRPGAEPLRLVDEVSLTLAPGERLALVGESGSGKSVLARSLLGLDRDVTRTGEMRLGGHVVDPGDEATLRAIRGRRIAMVFQNPLGALDPLMTIGAQITAPMKALGVVRREARDRAVSLLAELGIRDAANRLGSYPHEFSGGMRQRVALAMALATEPEILVADEPTTALDVRAQEQVLDVIDAISRSRGLGVIMITHDLSLVAGFADRVAVLYAGRIVQDDTTDALFADPAHPYARGLLGAVPRTDERVRRLTTIPGAIPPVASRPQGCVFHPRCPLAMAICGDELPATVPLPSGGHVACHLFSGGGAPHPAPSSPVDLDAVGRISGEESA